MSILMPNAAAFWSAQDSWIASAGATSLSTPSSGSLGAKEARWRLNGQRYMRHTGIKDADQLIRVEPGLQLKIVKLIEAIAPALVRAYDNELAPLAREVFEAWPVETGLSKKLVGLEFSTRDGGETFVGQIVSRAPYTIFIREGKKTNAEKEAARAKAQAIREAAARAGKLDRLGTSAPVGGASGNKATGPRVVQKLIDGPGKAVPAKILQRLELRP